MKLQQGQKVYLVWSQCYSNGFETVSKVGKKYAELENSRIKINMETMTAGETPTTAKVYLSKEDHDKELKINELWSEIFSFVKNNYKKPSWIEEEHMKEIVNLLGI